MRVDPASIDVVALTSRDLSGAAPPLNDRNAGMIVARALERGLTPQALVADDVSIPAELRRGAERRFEEIDEAEALLEQYAEAGIWCLTPFDERWPIRLSERLGVRAPSILYGVGDSSLLGTDGIGIVGSRNLAPEGEAVASAIGRSAAAAGLPVISGVARGADRIGMEGSLQRGGQAVGVLAHPLVRTARDRSVAEHVERGDLCLVTQFKPSAGFSVGAAMGRNKIVYALSQRTVVVASDHDSGGTWAGATEALRLLPGTVAVWRGPGEGPGNAALESRGAAPIAEATEATDASEPVGQLPLI